MYLKSIENPVHRSGHVVDYVLLQKAFDDMNRNFNEIQMQVHNQQLRNTEMQIINKHLMQLLNWIATTNPQILDEFQTTATAFDKLLPRDDGGSNVQSPQASAV
jgi:hypothetical protein